MTNKVNDLNLQIAFNAQKYPTEKCEKGMNH